MRRYRNVINQATIVALAAVGLFVATAAIAQNGDQLAAEFASLGKNDSTQGQDWFALAVKAREASDLSLASKALEQAEKLAFSPVAVGMEKSRVLLAKGSPAQAVAQLRALLDAGFTSVSAITGDAALSSMAGRADYDKLIDDMSILAYPCENHAGFSDFDFWVGQWDVRVANGTLVGSNVIKKAERGCVLIENWTNASGGTGMSINYLDKTSDEWVQVWNADGGSQINIRGRLIDDGMRLVGHLHNVAGGTTVPFRALFTPLPDGRVRQFFEQSNDEGKTWVVWFEGFYSRSE
jgi:hypothetical protein